MGFRSRSRTLSFKYVIEKLEGNIVYRPRVEIRLSNRDKTVKLIMLVDSGADTSFIPKEVAEVLELKLTNPKKSRSASGQFDTMQATVPSAELVKGVQRIPFGPIVVIVPVKPIDDDSAQNYALLGRREFFKQFDVTFRDTTKKLVLRSPKKT